MLRRLAPLAPLLLLALLTCQDYRFNPVGRCIIQPGQVRVPLSGVSTADILFVIDDSASMHPIQASLAANFQSFIQQLATIQANRVASGQEALDFYIAITSSAVLVNRGLPGVNCSGGTCNIANPAFPPAYSYACSGTVTCADIIDKFYGGGTCLVTTPTRACTLDSECPAGDSCSCGLAPGRGAPFFAGSFVAKGTNPKVLEFTKTLNWPAWQTDPTIQGLIARFGENIQVGDCGANQEMHLEASKLAVQKALLGQQGLPAGVSWPHDNSKLVVVWVGNEDDCSTRRADQGGLVWDGGAGNDSCENQAQLAPSQSSLYPVADYAGYLVGLGRPLGAAFIRPGDAGCNCNGLPCASNGFGQGTRFKALASTFRSQGIEVVEASVCGDFGATLAQIGDLVEPPQGLELPTQPAADVVTQLRVVGSDGKTTYVCSAPSTSGDWWFIDCDSPIQAPMPAGVTSKCIALQPNGPCVPSPGQALVAEYLGRVPAGGCPAGAAGAPSAECANALGGTASEWTCDGAAGQLGTCLCR